MSNSVVSACSVVEKNLPQAYKSAKTNKGMLNKTYKSARKDAGTWCATTALSGLAATLYCLNENAVSTGLFGVAFGLNLSLVEHYMRKMLDLLPAYKEIVARAKQIYKK